LPVAALAAAATASFKESRNDALHVSVPEGMVTVRWPMAIGNVAVVVPVIVVIVVVTLGSVVVVVLVVESLKTASSCIFIPLFNPAASQQGHQLSYCLDPVEVVTVIKSPSQPV